MLKISFLAKSFLVLGTLSLFAVINPNKVSASIGTIEMRSTTNEDYRCFASSLIESNNKYDVAVNCVNLIFPANPPQVSYYILWATPLSGKNPIKIGDLGKGVARFEVGEAFSDLFVTLETDSRVRNPSRNIVMNGEIEPIKFLQTPTTPTPTPEVTPGQKNQNAPVDTSQLSTKDKLLLALRRAGIAAVVALVAIVGLIFVVTRSRG
jgi:hypothetical protein